jgi:Lar family restriction alleviation protein
MDDYDDFDYEEPEWDEGDRDVADADVGGFNSAFAYDDATLAEWKKEAVKARVAAKQREGKMSRIKRCPFCGNDDCVLEATFHSFFVECQKCGARGPLEIFEEQAIDAWNQAGEKEAPNVKE